ncbi:biopolymer transporter ExbD [Stappia sp. F7233]|uniref:Biopolymer transporter ExbD n=1 Tax=Stappia albiluteola TaxID=2758565 RepID=A0A839ABV7_9HYPH|nr:biopolymer transporter ExbD [Stappia albiluteola]MBA5776169.1 biopolymer transporter ExbD [Stappia albiluteola]
MRLERLPAKRRPIGLTSLIDVIFLLLLFFMLASTFSRYQAAPLSGTGPGARAEPPPLLRIHSAARFELDGLELSPEDLAWRLAALKAEGRRTVAIVAEEEAKVQDIVSVMDRVSDVGLAGVLIAGE